ncbi:MAG: TonB-dependent receptor [Ignavibacteriales bacterium]|nr:TonB-dependent receptor [Ignavibacteriales bacterium]
MKQFLTLVLCVQISLSLFAQTHKPTISGLISDQSTGEPLIGANLVVYKDSLISTSIPLKGTATNKYGFYALPEMDYGVYLIAFRNIGYKLEVKRVEVTKTTENIRLNVQLNEESITLEEVTIKGERNTKTEISTINISPDIIKQLPSLSGEANVFKSLEYIPGVKVANELSNGIYVRGGSPDQTLTLLDGVILYNPSHLGNFASTFNSNALQDVRLLKGAFPAEYGGRLSSVLDIKLRSGTKQKTKGSLGLGLINSGFMIEGPVNEKSTIMLSGRKMYYDFIQNSFNKNSTLPRYNFYDLNAKINYNLDENSKIFVSGMFGKDNLYSPTNSKDIDYDIQWQNASLSLNWLNINNESLFSNTWFSFISYEFTSKLNDKNNNSGSGDYYSSSQLQDFIVKRAVEYMFDETHTIKSGIELTLHKYRLIYSDYYDPELQDDDRIGTDNLSLETAIYFQDELQITPLLTTNAGVRLYFFNKSKYFRAEPRFSATYALNENIFIKGAFAIAHQFLHLIVRNDISLPTDLWYPSTTNINPSKSLQYVFGVESYFDNQAYLFSVEGYYKEMQDLYEFGNIKNKDLSKPIEDQFTSGKGESYGMELFFNKRAGDLMGWIGYSLSWTKRKFDELNGGNIFYPRYDRRHDISIVLTYNFTQNFNCGITWTYASGQGYTVPTGQYQFGDIGIGSTDKIQFNNSGINSYRLPDYHKLDFSASYKFSFSNLAFETYLNLFNLYNRKNAFAQYISYDNAAGTNSSASGTDRIPKLKQLTLFPFIPTLGVNIKF